jgi:hypothetical protein
MPELGSVVLLSTVLAPLMIEPLLRHRSAQQK